MQQTYTYSKLGNYGALGNQLWQIAGVIGEADKANTQALFPKWEYEKYFSVPHAHFEPSQYEIMKDFYPDYMQSLSHFDHIFKYIREIFAPSDFAAMKIDTLFDDFHLPIIAVHVRRGNNLTLPDYHPVPPLEYFEAALSQMPTNKCDMLVFSDDLDWCRKQSLFKDAHFGLGVPPGINIFDFTGAKPLTTEEAALDLLSIANCHYHIISNSTFSWWGAWLANSRKVVYPEPWFGRMYNDVDVSVMFPSEWIKLKIEPVWTTI